jgi:hypothetical protein
LFSVDNQQILANPGDPLKIQRDLPARLDIPDIFDKDNIRPFLFETNATLGFYHHT